MLDPRRRGVPAIASTGAAIAALLLAPALFAQIPSPLTTTLVADGFDEPVHVTSPAGDCDRLFVVEKTGAIRIVKHGAVLPTPFLNLTAKVLVSYERGLLGLAFHPKYAENGLFYVDYARQPDGALVIERYRVSTNPDVADPPSATAILTIPHPTYDNHNAGMLAFGPNDGYLYISTGDGGGYLDPNNNAQNTGNLLGKILRIDVNHAGGLPYAIPPDNPFLLSGSGADEIWSYGLRNPWRFSFDRATGDLFIGDVGQDGREEIDFQAAGTPGGINYGWRCMEGFQCTSVTGPPMCLCGAPWLTLPIYDYDHSFGCVVIGGYVYRGTAIPSLQGTYLFGDHCSDRFWSFHYDGASITNLQERTAELQAPPGINNVTSFGEDAAGELYLTYRSGALMKIVPVFPNTIGMIAYGSGTPGCKGAHALTGSCIPKIGVPCFRLECTNAPPKSEGLCVITNVLSTGGDVLGLGVDTLVDFITASAVLTFGLPVDAHNVASLAIPFPNNPAAVGVTFFAQSFFAWGTACALPPFGLSASHGLAITLQP